MAASGGRGGQGTDAGALSELGTGAHRASVASASDPIAGDSDFVSCRRQLARSFAAVISSALAESVITAVLVARVGTAVAAAARPLLAFFLAFARMPPRSMGCADTSAACDSSTIMPGTPGGSSVTA